MKVVRFSVISLLLGLLYIATGYAAGKEVKLIGVEQGTNNNHLTADVIGDSIIIGARGAGLANLYTGRGEKWKLEGTLIAKDANQRDPAVPAFAWSVALSAPHELASPTFAVIGAPKDLHGGDNDQGIFGPQGFGAVYIFAPIRGAWKQQTKIIAPSPKEDDQFGSSVSVERSTIFIGAPGEDGAAKNGGAGYIFERDGDEWKRTATIVPKDLGGLDAFGECSAIRGNTVVVGAPGHTHGGVRFAGAAYVFVRSGDTWKQQAKLTANDAGKADRFGHSVDMAGETIIVGSPLNDTEKGKDAGAAYVFVRDGNRWKQQAKLTSANSRPGDQFGFGVATTGSAAVVGAPLRDERAPASGAAYSFVRVIGAWESVKKIVLDDERQKLNFGTWVAMSGNTVVVSAHNDTNDGAGWGNGTAGYVYNSVDDFGTPPFAVEPFGLAVTTIGGIKRSALFQNFPNPFNPETWMPYRLAADSPVAFHIYDVQGQLIRELNVGVQKAGSYLNRDTAVYWDGRDQIGQTVSSGVYFYAMQADAFRATRRMLILK
ncbi:MAG: hypothetical protein OXN17_22845 [Candidatus Poribacteria bacterium]|nr:hypothetical protein [Candidatus Poribacteria bacterium]